MDVIGTPEPPSAGRVYRRSGPYHLKGRQLVTPALNEGKPVEVWLEDGKLALEIDPSLTFRLRRDSSESSPGCGYGTSDVPARSTGPPARPAKSYRSALVFGRAHG